MKRVLLTMLTMLLLLVIYRRKFVYLLQISYSIVVSFVVVFVGIY